MLLELPKSDKTAHFNLYAEREGALVQMTKDHKTPKSRGGKDHIDNMQTMCCRCNELKGNKKGNLKKLREIQDGVQTIYMVVDCDQVLDRFATSDKGLTEIVRKQMVEVYHWPENSFKIQVNIELNTIEILDNNENSEFYFTIKPIRRI